MANLGWAGRGILLALLLADASCCDIRSRKVPDRYSAWILMLALFTSDTGKWWGIFCALPFFIAALTSGGIGGADIKIMGAVGMVLGFLEGISAMVIGLSGMLIFHMAKCLLQKGKGKERSYPFIPFLAAGIMLIYIMNRPGQ